MTTSDDLLVQIYDIVDHLLTAYDRSPTIHTVAPFVSLLRVWRNTVNQILDARDASDHRVRPDDVPL